MKKSKFFIVFSIAIVLFVLFGIGIITFFVGLFFTGCDYENNDDTSKVSIGDLKNLQDTLDETVQTYFLDKYNATTTITYQSIAGGVFLGPDPSSEQYYLLIVNVAKDSEVTKCQVHVYGRKVDGVGELYVKKESYYGYVIKEKMEKWLDGYMNNTNIEEYYSRFHTYESLQFPSEYNIGDSAEEIIKSVSSIEDIKERPRLRLYVIIPQSEYEKHPGIENEFSELKTDINTFNSKVYVDLVVYCDEDYLKRKSGDESDFEQLEYIEIVEEY